MVAPEGDFGRRRGGEHMKSEFGVAEWRGIGQRATGNVDTIPLRREEVKPTVAILQPVIECVERRGGGCHCLRNDCVPVTSRDLEIKTSGVWKRGGNCDVRIPGQRPAREIAGFKAPVDNQLGCPDFARNTDDDQREEDKEKNAAAHFARPFAWSKLRELRRNPIPLLPND